MRFDSFWPNGIEGLERQLEDEVDALQNWNREVGFSKTPAFIPSFREDILIDFPVLHDHGQILRWVLNEI